MEKFVFVSPCDYPAHYYIHRVAYKLTYQGKHNKHTSDSGISPETSSNTYQSGPSNLVSPNALTNINNNVSVIMPSLAGLQKLSADHFQAFVPLIVNT